MSTRFTNYESSESRNVRMAQAFGFACGVLPNEGLEEVVLEMYDHKGMLMVLFNREPSDLVMAVFRRAWAEQCEEYVGFYVVEKPKGISLWDEDFPNSDLHQGGKFFSGNG